MKRRKSVVILVLLALFLLAFSGCAKTEAPARTAIVPELSGLALEEAGDLLAREGLAVGSITQEFSDTVAAGLVLSTLPAAGEEMEEGSPVDLVVSRGPELVTVPDLRGRPESEAAAALQALGLEVNVQRAYSESLLAGLVCVLDPAPGTQLKKGSAVTLTVSLGSAYVTCPTCGGRGTVTVSETCHECGGSGVCYM